jgi:hypothetical protein
VQRLFPIPAHPFGWGPPSRAGTVRTFRAAVANRPRGIVGPYRLRSEAGRAVRAAVPVLRCRGFSPRQLRPWCRAEHASNAVLPALHRAGVNRLGGLAAALDPLRLSTEGAEPDRTTSDVLCRSASASARSPPRLRPAGLSFVRHRSEPVEPGPFEGAARLEATSRRTQDAFGGWDARSCDRAGLVRVRWSARAPRPAPLSPGPEPPCPSRLASGPCYPALARTEPLGPPSRT